MSIFNKSAAPLLIWFLAEHCDKTYGVNLYDVHLDPFSVAKNIARHSLCMMSNAIFTTIMVYSILPKEDKTKFNVKTFLLSNLATQAAGSIVKNTFRLAHSRRRTPAAALLMGFNQIINSIFSYILPDLT